MESPPPLSLPYNFKQSILSNRLNFLICRRLFDFRFGNIEQRGHLIRNVEFDDYRLFVLVRIRRHIFGSSVVDRSALYRFDFRFDMGDFARFNRERDFCGWENLENLVFRFLYSATVAAISSSVIADD